MLIRFSLFLINTSLQVSLSNHFYQRKIAHFVSASYCKIFQMKLHMMSENLVCMQYAEYVFFSLSEMNLGVLLQG